MGESRLAGIYFPLVLTWLVEMYLNHLDIPTMIGWIIGVGCTTNSGLTQLILGVPMGFHLS